MTTILATISTLCIVISAILIAIGWTIIRKTGNQKRHQKVMVTAASFALTFFIIYMTRTVFLGNVEYAGPNNIELPYHIFLVFHIILATVGGIMGIISLYLGFKGRFKIHRRISPYTAIIWFLTAITGSAVYLILFVLWPSANLDTSLFNSIFG